VKNKLAVINVIASLIRQPNLLLDARYPLTPDDFPERFHKIVFGAVEHLVRSGARQISEVDIDNFLAAYPEQHRVFTENAGMDYITQALEITSNDNYAYYHATLKKCALLNALHDVGFDISPFYDPSAIGYEDVQAVQTKLDSHSLEEILGTYELSLSQLKTAFGANGGRKSIQAAQGMKALKERLKELPEMGVPMNSKKLTTICRGRRLKKFYMKTLPSGLGKSRMSLADAALISIPVIYDLEQHEWVRTNCQEPTLFITTELEADEVQTMIMAYVSGVDEEHILDGKYVGDEEARVNRACEIVSDAPFYIDHVPEFNVDDIENIIREYKLRHGIKYVFFDYIFTSIKVLMEMSKKTRGVSIREDNVLVMFSSRMKDLCNAINVHIDTSTQANGEWKTMKDPDQNIIRGAKGMSDKVDIGYCGLPPTEKDLEAVRSIMAQMGQNFFKPPNLVYHIYKVRRGKLNSVKLFVHFDYGTLRTTDLFVTDRDYHYIDVDSTQIEMVLDHTEVKRKSEAMPTW